MIVGYATAKGYNKKNTLDQKDKGYKAWNDRYPYYIELTNGKFLKQPIREGISLINVCNTLMHQMYPNTINKPGISISEIRKRHHQKAHIQITATAMNYLRTTLDKIFSEKGFDSI